MLESGKYYDGKDKWHDRDYSFMGSCQWWLLSGDWVNLGRRTCDYTNPISGRRKKWEGDWKDGMRGVREGFSTSEKSQRPV